MTIYIKKINISLKKGTLREVLYFQSEVVGIIFLGLSYLWENTPKICSAKKFPKIYRIYRKGQAEIFS